MQVDLNRPLPPALRLAGWPGETVYSFAHRLERRLHATRGVISHLAYADVSRVLGTRATPAQVTERMVTLCQTLCQLEPGTLSSPMDKGSFSAHLCAECVGDPGAEHVWDGHRYTCSAHHRWVAPGPSPKRPSTYTPHPPGEWTAHRVPPEVVEADLQIADLYSKGRITARLVEEVVRRVGSARGAEHHGVARPGDLSWVAAVLASVIDPEVQAVVLDETVPFADRYARLSTMLEARVPQRTPELCDQVWLLLRPTAVWVRSVLHGEAAVDAFEPALLPEAGLDLSAIRYPMEPFYRSMDCLRTAGRDDDRWWENRYVVSRPATGGALLLICDNGHVQRTSKGHARRYTGEAFHCSICSGQRVVAGLNSLSDVFPRLRAEWDHDANGDLTPFMVSPGTNKKVGWIDDKGHRYRAYITNRTKHGTGCPGCAGKAVQAGYNDLATTHPELAALWDHEDNGELEPTNVSAGNSKLKIHLRCAQGHPFTRTPAKLVETGGRCQKCIGRILIPGTNDLATLRPDIAAWWHPTRNGDLTPSMVKTGSEVTVWWQCQDRHDFQETITYRCHQKKINCPVDTGRLLLAGVNDLATKEPGLVKDWDPILNPTKPSQTVATNRPWSWTCRFGHTQSATVANRRRAGGCTECAPEDRVARGQRKLTRGRQGWDTRKRNGTAKTRAGKSPLLTQSLQHGPSSGRSFAGTRP